VRAPGLPSVFVSHGAPTIALEDGGARRFLVELGARLGRPRAIAVVSAHWETDDVRVLGTPAPATVHDFHGFAPALHAMRYPAPGAQALAAEIAALLAQAGIAATVEGERGLDHGAWIPLTLMYPEADVPVTQVSVRSQAPAAFHWRLGRCLAELRQSGVLILGSGSITHNLGEVRFRRDPTAASTPPPYARAFCDWVADRVAASDATALQDWQAQAPAALRAHPSPEHFLPFLVALGAAGPDWTGERVHHSFTYDVIGMDCYLFHARPTH
jgi:4,5-DOPA dioxygenase extradiol